MLENLEIQSNEEVSLKNNKSPQILEGKLILDAIDTFQTYFKEALLEIRQLRRECGEKDWINRELKTSVSEKARNIRLLIKKLERAQRNQYIVSQEDKDKADIDRMHQLSLKMDCMQQAEEQSEEEVLPQVNDEH